MFYKAINKFTGNVDGWGEDSSFENYCGHWNLKQVDIEEITKDEFEKLFNNVHSSEEETRKMIGKLW